MMQTEDGTGPAPPRSVSDAERLTSPFGQAITESPSRIAPERSEELRVQVFGGKGCDLFFDSGKANFFAYPGTAKISTTYAALLSLWALSSASLELADLMAEAARQKIDRLDTKPGTRAHEALKLVEAARTF